jgi:integrase
MARLPQGFRVKGDRIEHRFTEGGKQYSVYGLTVKECREKELEKREEIRRGSYKRGADQRMKDYLTRYLENREGSLSGATMRVYGKLIKRMNTQRIDQAGHTFGQLKLSALETQNIRDLQRALLRDGLQTRTVNDSLSLLKKALEAAVNERIIEWNPARGVDRLKRTEPQARDTIHRALDPAEVQAFMDGAREAESAYYNLYLFLLHTGLRIGEAGALTIADLRGKQIQVHKTITRTQFGYEIAEQTKTAAGLRSVPMTEQAREAVDAQKIQNRLLYGSKVIEAAKPLFRMPGGGILRADRVNSDIKRICEKSGVKYFSVHAFRATFTSRCVAAGMNTRDLMEILGHVDVQMTLGLYAHSRDDQKREALQAVAF